MWLDRCVSVVDVAVILSMYISRTFLTVAADSYTKRSKLYDTTCKQMVGQRLVSLQYSLPQGSWFSEGGGSRASVHLCDTPYLRKSMVCRTPIKRGGGTSFFGLSFGADSTQSAVVSTATKVVFRSGFVKESNQLVKLLLSMRRKITERGRSAGTAISFLGSTA